MKCDNCGGPLYVEQVPTKRRVVAGDVFVRLGWFEYRHTVTGQNVCSITPDHRVILAAVDGVTGFNPVHGVTRPAAART